MPNENEVAVAEKFYSEVCALAESNMLKTGKLEGSHFAAMQTVIKQWKASLWNVSVGDVKKNK